MLDMLAWARFKQARAPARELPAAPERPHSHGLHVLLSACARPSRREAAPPRPCGAAQLDPHFSFPQRRRDSPPCVKTSSAAAAGGETSRRVAAASGAASQRSRGVTSRRCEALAPVTLACRDACRQQPTQRDWQQRGWRRDVEDAVRLQQRLQHGGAAVASTRRARPRPGFRARPTTLRHRQDGLSASKACGGL